MSTTNNGGAAFPVPQDMLQDGQWSYAHPGMSLRQWYAGMAMQGILTNPYYDPLPVGDMAKCAYAVADAMLKAAGEEGAK